MRLNLGKPVLYLPLKSFSIKYFHINIMWSCLSITIYIQFFFKIDELNTNKQWIIFNLYVNIETIITTIHTNNKIHMNAIVLMKLIGDENHRVIFYECNTKRHYTINGNVSRKLNTHNKTSIKIRLSMRTVKFLTPTQHFPRSNVYLLERI